MSETMVDKLLSSGEVADLLNVSQPSVWNWTQAGLLRPEFRLPAGKGGRRGASRFRMSEVDRFRATMEAAAVPLTTEDASKTS